MADNELRDMEFPYEPMVEALRTAIVQAHTADEAVAIALSAPTKYLRGVADLLYIEEPPSVRYALVRAVVKEARA